MKIIKKGAIQPEKGKEETCFKCHTVFEYVPSDIESNKQEGQYVACPVCGYHHMAGSTLATAYYNK